MENFEKNKSLILSRLGIGESALLGVGVESYVYAYNKNQVVKILKAGDIVYLESLKKLQKLISVSNLSVKTPVTISIGELNGVAFTIEERLAGQNLSKIFDTYSGKQKEAIILKYFNLISELRKVHVEGVGFGQILKVKDKISSKRWGDFLKLKVKQKTDQVGQQLEKDVVDFESKLGQFVNIVDSKLGNVERNLVHGDFFYDNIMADENAKITGLLDFSGWTSVVGDFRLDVNGAIIFLEHSEKFIGYQNLLTNIAKERYGEDIGWYIDFYRIYYCLFLSDSYLYLKPLYDWCVKNLNDESLWKRVQQ